LIRGDEVALNSNQQVGAVFRPECRQSIVTLSRDVRNVVISDRCRRPAPQGVRRLSEEVCAEISAAERGRCSSRCDAM
jgi:hypothetical protein